MNKHREALENIFRLADGRRHYDGTDDYTCFDALGDVRQMAQEALGGRPPCDHAGMGPGLLAFCLKCGMEGGW